jgi:hypothetical protein
LDQASHVYGRCGTSVYKAHSVRSALSTKAVEKGHSIQAVMEHAGWSLNTNTFERFYYKPSAQESSSTAITNSIFLSEKPITLGVGMEPTEIVIGTTNNQYVGSIPTPNVIDARPWYRRLFDS